MLAIPIVKDFEARLKRRGVWPLSDVEKPIPDEWAALLDQLHGQPEQDERCA